MSDEQGKGETWEYDEEERFYCRNGVEQTTSDVLTALNADHERVRVLQQQVADLRSTTYRCESMCEAAQYGGSCRCSELSNELPAQVAHAEAAEAQVSVLQQELEGLTPGGSEFVSNTERCLEFVRARLASAGQLAAERNALRAQARVLPAVVEALAARCWFCARGYPRESKHTMRTPEQWAERAGTTWELMQVGKTYNEFYGEGAWQECGLTEVERDALAAAEAAMKGGE